jgi:drug/metabolite transporter (DMT)-like permease
MIYLLLSVLLSVLTVSFFKLFERYGVHTLQVIVVNYVTCILIGNCTAPEAIILQPFWKEDWFPYAVILGFVFISTFYTIGFVSQKIGVSVSMVAAKLSVVIPVTIAFLFHGENASGLKILGILISLVAVYLISKKEKENTPNSIPKRWALLLTLFVFAASGIIDSVLKYLQRQFIPPSNAGDILSTIFLVACCCGILVLLVKKEPLQAKSIGWGILFAIPNFYSMFFLVKTLEIFDASFIFPINNIGIVVCSTLVSLSFFKEKLSLQNWLGFGLALFSILIISFA